MVPFFSLLRRRLFPRLTMVLSLGSSARFVTLVRNGTVSVLSRQFFPQTGLKVFRMRVNFFELL
jgi:hypothetical protein